MLDYNTYFPILVGQTEFSERARLVRGDRNRATSVKFQNAPRTCGGLNADWFVNMES